MLILSCQGHVGSFSFTDIEIIPKPDNERWSSPNDLVSACLEQSDTSSIKMNSRTELRIEEVLVTTTSNFSAMRPSATLVTHVLFDEISSLEWTLRTWTDPVSIVILVPVPGDSIQNKLDTWQK